MIAVVFTSARKRYSTATASNPPMIAVLRTSLMLLSMNFERSATISQFRAFFVVKPLRQAVLLRRRDPPRPAALASSSGSSSMAPTASVHGLGHGHHVGVGLLVDVDLHALRAVGARVMISRSFCVRTTASEVLHAHVAILNASDDGIPDLVEALVLVERADHVLGAAFLERAAGDVDVLLAQPVDDRLNRKSAALERLLIEQDVVLLLEPAPDAHRGNAFDRFEGAFDLQLGDAAQAAQALFALRNAGPRRRNSVP